MLRGKSVLELGCGSGIDSRFISGLTNNLVPGDIDPKTNSGNVLILDHSKPLPFKNETFDTVVASLTLHYFSKSITKDIIKEISRVLRRQGTVICRLNSYKDENYGAVGHPEIEPGLYNVNGEQKRFFREEEITELWSHDFIPSAILHKSIDRYEHAKFVYEFTAIKA